MTAPKIKRLKKYDTKAGHKVLLHIYIKDSCFHCDVKQVVKGGGDICYNREDQKSFIEEFAPEYKNMIRLDRVNLDGRSGHDIANSIYFAKETIKKVAEESIGGKIYTSEDHQEKLKALWDSVIHHRVFSCDNWHLHKKLREYQDKRSDLYRYKDFKSCADFHIARLVSSIVIKDARIVKERIFDYFDKLDQYRTLEGKYQFKSLPCRCELWTITRFADHMGITENEAKVLLLSSTKEEEIKRIVLVNSEKMKKELDSIVKQYKLLPNS